MPTVTDNVLSDVLVSVPSLAVKRSTTAAVVAGGVYEQVLETGVAPDPLHPAPNVPLPLTIDQLQVIASPFGSDAIAERVTAAEPGATEPGTLILVIVGAEGGIPYLTVVSR